MRRNEQNVTSEKVLVKIIMDQVKVKQEVFGLGSCDNNESKDFCVADEAVAIGEYKNKKDAQSEETCV